MRNLIIRLGREFTYLLLYGEAKNYASGDPIGCTLIAYN